MSLSLENERCVGSAAAAGAHRGTAPGPGLGPRAVPALGPGHGGRVGAGPDDGVVGAGHVLQPLAAAITVGIIWSNLPHTIVINDYVH